MIKVVDRKLIQMEAKYELARRKFFFYCNLKAPKFYKQNRKYLVDLCNTFQDFYEGTDDVLIINLPPRHGKSRTASLLVEWILGNNKEEKIITGSYNETLSMTFSKSIRNDIMETKADDSIPVFSDVFPNTKIKRGDGSMNLWSLEGGYNNYLATSPSGTVTGFGASILVIDDIIKNAEEANNENVKEKHWNWFTNTMLSRLEEGGKIIIIMTRWASDDLAGKVLDWCIEKNKKYKHISMKALLDKDTKQMLCSDVLSYESYLDKISIMGEDIASANYQQEPIDLKGCLYTKLKTYTDIPEFEQIKSYTDTADTGADYLCSIVYGVYRKEAYVIDVLYTQAGMDVTEDMVADMFYRTGCNIANIESNSGGMSFARNIKRILKEKYDTNRCIIKPFHNSKNKNSRIFSNSAWVMEHIYFPHNWRDKWPEYYKAMISYQRAGKNKHDDAPDATTGIAEFCNKGISVFK